MFRTSADSFPRPGARLFREEAGTDLKGAAAAGDADAGNGG